MSLHEALGGILETQVIWEDLEKQLRTALQTNATFGPAKNVIDIGEGNGFASRCGLVSCDWKGAEESEKLPCSVVIKIPSALPFKQMNVIQGDSAMWAGMETKLRELHNIEIASYKYFEVFDGLKMPKMYYGKEFTNENQLEGQISLEYVKNSRVMNFYEAHTVEQVKQIARALGKIQACSLKKDVTAPEFDVNMHADFSKTVSLECTHFGVGVQDLLRISLFALPAKERRESAAMLVEEMYNSMVENLDGAEPPYSLEKLQSIYDILFPHSASYFAGGGIVIMIKQMNNAKLTMDMKELRKAVQMDKVLGALEDILQYHSQNKELVKDLKFRDH
ncbi:hypothetical protein PMAYCL1PPCAC_21103 [Pristionchus mayeri]|uniref:Uncharacterized protein n=1 Tax=Pristionchus mayeri TaxID=1317129 RepID=A0AAN5I3Q6_9BILA|nr:hypothetical protein PMAYCL1PPCAC_21103 [Pristionchus mayeri]